MPQTQPYIPTEFVEAGRSLKPAFLFQGHVYARVFDQTYRLDYVPVPLTEDDAQAPMKDGTWLGYELAQAICHELQLTIESESAVNYLNCGQSTNVMATLRAAAEAERSACYRRLGTLKSVATGLFRSA